MTCTSVVRPTRRLRYWCDKCQEEFHGVSAIPHQGARCYADETPPAPETPSEPAPVTKPVDPQAPPPIPAEEVPAGA